MKKPLIIIACVLVTMMSCTKSKEVHPELGDGNDEIVTVGKKDVHVEYLRTDITELQKVVFHYSLAEVQQFAAAEMTRREDRFELTLTNLLSDTLYSYYYELFSMDGETSLTGKKTFHTQIVDTPEPPTPPTPPSDIPEGAINGLFTINDNGDQVYFSQGNLQYSISTQNWSFVEYQYDMVEMGGQTIGTNYSNQDIVSLFGWGTSGWNNGNLRYQPYETGIYQIGVIGGDIGFGYGPTDGTNYDYDLTGDYANADWGVYNAISNGGNTPNLWRTLTIDEWDYVINTRSTPSGIRYAKGEVNGVNGVILLPDDWDSSVYTLDNANTPDVPYSNSITLVNWEIMEIHGAIFLPAAGGRDGVNPGGQGHSGSYWSASCCDSYGGYVMFFYNNSVYEMGDLSTTGYSNRYMGCSVRLVQDANK